MSEPLSFTDAPDEAAPKIGMAPLVDIVLLLICFYLFVMQSIQSHAEEDINLPRLASEQTIDQVPAALTINLNAEGVVRLNGEVVDDATLTSMLMAEHARAVSDGQTLHVVVRADREQPFDRLDAILAACREAELSTVLIRSTRDGLR